MGKGLFNDNVSLNKCTTHKVHANRLKPYNDTKDCPQKNIQSQKRDKQPTVTDKQMDNLDAQDNVPNEAHNELDRIIACRWRNKQKIIKLSKKQALQDGNLHIISQRLCKASSISIQLWLSEQSSHGGNILLGKQYRD